MSAPEKPSKSSQNGAREALSGAKGDFETMRQDWLSRMREPESGWDEPAFPEQSGEQAEQRPPAEAADDVADEEQGRRRFGHAPYSPVRAP